MWRTKNKESNIQQGQAYNKTKHAKQNVLIASLIKRLRIAVNDNHLDVMDALIKEGQTLKEFFSDNVWDEVGFVSDIVRHRKIVQILADGVVKGRVTGEVGKINYHDIPLFFIIY